MELNESPVFLLFHTQQSIVRKDLPVSLYESGTLALHMPWISTHMQKRAAAALCTFHVSLPIKPVTQQSTHCICTQTCQ